MRKIITLVQNNRDGLISKSIHLQDVRIGNYLANLTKLFDDKVEYFSNRLGMPSKFRVETFSVLFTAILNT